MLKAPHVRSAIIPDGDLEAYLADKITVKPDYGFDTEVTNYAALSKEASARISGDKLRQAKKSRR